VLDDKVRYDLVRIPTYDDDGIKSFVNDELRPGDRIVGLYPTYEVVRNDAGTGVDSSMQALIERRHSSWCCEQMSENGVQEPRENVEMPLQCWNYEVKSNPGVQNSRIVVARYGNTQLEHVIAQTWCRGDEFEVDDQALDEIAKYGNPRNIVIEIDKFLRQTKEGWLAS